MARLKVVAHKKSGHLVKGYTELDVEGGDSGIFAGGSFALPKTVNILPTTEGRVAHVTLDSLKALFFVKSFAGDPSYAETKFFNPESKLEGLWVHITFEDGETTEGVVHNGIEILNEPGFLMKPPDPQSNNNALYILKSALSKFRVVGVRSHY